MESCIIDWSSNRFAHTVGSIFEVVSGRKVSSGCLIIYWSSSGFAHTVGSMFEANSHRRVRIECFITDRLKHGWLAGLNVNDFLEAIGAGMGARNGPHMDDEWMDGRIG